MLLLFFNVFRSLIKKLQDDQDTHYCDPLYMILLCDLMYNCYLYFQVIHRPNLHTLF